MHESFDFALLVVDEVAFDGEVGGSGIDLCFPEAFGGIGFYFLQFGQPAGDGVSEVVVLVESLVYFIEFDAVPGCDDADMQYVFLVEDVIEFSVLFVFHPHAATALV
jgi:hypothetical protein